MKCVKCGKESREKYCERCYLEEKPLIKNYKKISLITCRGCGRHLYRNKWIKDRINDLIKENITFDDKLKIDNIDYDLDNKEINKEIIITVDASYGKQSTQQSLSLPISLVKKQCQDCSKKGQYFEAILQLRGPRDEIFNFIENEVEKEPGVFINEELKVEGGIDFYLTSNKFAQKLGKRLQQIFGGELKINPRLHSRDKHSGKELYRLSVLFRPSEFGRGDIVSFGGKIIRIKGGAKKITGIDIVSDKKVIIKYSKTKPELLKVYEVSVSKTYPHLEIIHPETYQSVKVENAKKTTQEQVKIVIHNHKVYVI